MSTGEQPTSDSRQILSGSEARIVASRYLGSAGRHYAATVQRHRAESGRLNRDKFAPLVRCTDSVLDFGCASGALLLALDVAERLGVEVNEQTRREAAAAGVLVFDSVAFIPEDRVDVVISNHALEHVLSPYAVLRSLRRVLRPEGRLVLCVPADDWRNEPRWRPDDANHHVFAWTPLTLGNLLQEAGFDPVSVRMCHRAWPPMYWRLSRLPRPIWETLCFGWATLRRRREILAVAVRSSGQHSS
jgi:SAM-dependent methyltransferase